MALLRLVFVAAALAAALAAQAQIAFRGAASAGVAATGNITYGGQGAAASRNNCGNINPALPAGTAAGNLLIAFVVAREELAVVTMAGWNTLFSDTPAANNNYQAHIFWRIATGGDPNTINQAGICSSIGGRISRFINVDTTQPFETAPLPAGNWVFQNSNNADTGTQVTTVPNAMLVVGVFIRDNRTSGVPAGFTEAYDSSLNLARDLAFSLKYQLQTTAGTKGPFLNMGFSGGGSDPNHGVLFALRPRGLRIAVPAATVAGDLMVASIAVRPSTTTITPPVGWSAQPATVQGAGNSNRQQIFYRVASAADVVGGVTYAWTFGAASTGAVGGIVAYSGVDTVTPFDVFSGNVTPSGISHTANSVTTTVPNTMVVSTHSFSSAMTWTPPAGMTERVDVASIATPNAFGISLEMNDVAQATAGATGNKTATVTGNADTGVAHLFALRQGYTHYSVTYPGGANIATCEPALARIEAHHAGHGLAAPPSGTILTISTSSASGVWQSAVVTGTGVWSPSGANDGVATYTWPGSEAVLEVRLRHNTPVALNLNLSDTQLKSEDATEDPTLTFADSVLRVTADGASAATVDPQIAGKRSDTGAGAQTLFVQGVATAPATGNCTTLFQNQTLSVDFAAVCENPTTCSGAAGTDFEVQDNASSFVSIAKNNGPGAPASYTAVTLAFSNDANAMAPLVFRYGDAGQMTLYMRTTFTVPPSVSTITISGSSNAFVVRPFGLAFRGATEPTVIQHGTLPTDPLLAAAGDNFTMTVAAYKWDAAEDDGSGNPLASANITDNGLTPNFASSTAVSATGNLPGIATGTMSRGAGCASAATIAAGSWAGGAATVADWCYSEAGNVFLQAQAANYISAGVDVTGNSGLDGTGAAGGHVGRFRPKHFALSAGSITNRATASPACSPPSTFTYMNEALDLGFTLTAQNTQGAPTLNYTGAYAKHDPTAGGSNDPKTAFALGARGTIDLTGRLSAVYAGAVPAWASGVLAIPPADAIRTIIARATPDGPDGPHDPLNLGIAPTDSDGVAMNTLDLDVDGVGGNDHKDLGVTTKLRFGRLRMQNALGSEKLALPVPIETQYWNGTAFATNTDDSCTSIPRSAIALDFSPPSNLVACETAVSTDPVTFSSGVGSLTLSAPGATNNGTVLLTVNLGSAGGSYCDPGSFVPATDAGMSYLLGRWNDASNPDGDANTSYDDKPSARAAFGVYGAQPKNFIYFRENY